VFVHKLQAKERFTIDGRITVMKMSGNARAYGFIGNGTIHIVGKSGINKTVQVNDPPFEPTESWETSNDLLKRHSVEQP
jgi:hypothetical protein